MVELSDWEERAAIMEYEGGLSRFMAESLAAEQFGKKRWEFIHAVKQRNSKQARNPCPNPTRNPAHDMPGVQPQQAQKIRSLPQCNFQAGRDSVALLALPLDGGRIL